MLAVKSVVLSLVSFLVVNNGADGATINRAPVFYESDPVPFSAVREYKYMAVTNGANNCSGIGVDIMVRKKGSAVDGTIASFLCECIINPHHCGIGGGHVSTIYEAPRGKHEKKMYSVTSRESAPAASSRDMFIDKPGASASGGLAVAVPSEIHGFHEEWKKFGRVAWKDLFTEAIRLCEEGFIVERSLAKAIVETEITDPNLLEFITNEDGTLIREGDLLVNPKLGKTLRIIADDPQSFYHGQLAEDIVADLKEHGGIITLEDLKEYSQRNVFRTPLTTTLSNGEYTLYNPPPPTSGAVLDFILQILNGFNLTPSDIEDSKKKGLTYHRIAEAFKFAYAKRSQLGDEHFVEVKELIANLTSAEYAESIRAQIDDKTTHDLTFYGPTFDIQEPRDHGTADMNVFSPDGGAVALTGTINTDFGAKIRGRRTGIIFNNEMDDFSTPGTINSFGVRASPSNYIVPGKMPQSSMCPTITKDKDGRVVMVSGAAGGTRITTSTAFVMAHSLWLGLDMQEAFDTARLHHQLLPAYLDYEPWLEEEVLEELRARKHNVVLKSTGYSYVGVIRNICPVSHKESQMPLDSCIRAVSDGRKGGHPDGF